MRIDIYHQGIDIIQEALYTSMENPLGPTKLIVTCWSMPEAMVVLEALSVSFIGEDRTTPITRGLLETHGEVKLQSADTILYAEVINNG